MNNRSLVNLKFTWHVLDNEEFRIETMSRLDLETLKPLGWHTYSRAMVRKIVSMYRAIQADPSYAVTDDDSDVLDDIRHHFRNRHNVPKGWHI